MHIKTLLSEYNSFNAGTLRNSAESLYDHYQNNGKLIISIAGALSTAGIGVSLSKMITSGFCHGIVSTAANFEEDLVKVISNEYESVDWRSLNKQDEIEFTKNNQFRVTDKLIPVNSFQTISKYFSLVITESQKNQKRLFPHELGFQAINKYISENKVNDKNLNNSWVLAAQKSNVPIFIPGWEDSTLASHIISQKFSGANINYNLIKNGLEYFESFGLHYLALSANSPVGLLQAGGGIAGDFAACVVPMLSHSKFNLTKRWAYLCQISDATTSYGGFSGAPPNEKISWGKVDLHTSSHFIQSDATIVLPLLFNYILSANMEK